MTEPDITPGAFYPQKMEGDVTDEAQRLMTNPQMLCLGAMAVLEKFGTIGKFGSETPTTEVIVDDKKEPMQLFAAGGNRSDQGNYRVVINNRNAEGHVAPLLHFGRGNEWKITDGTERPVQTLEARIAARSIIDLLRSGLQTQAIQKANEFDVPTYIREDVNARLAELRREVARLEALQLELVVDNVNVAGYRVQIVDLWRSAGGKSVDEIIHSQTPADAILHACDMFKERNGRPDIQSDRPTIIAVLADGNHVVLPEAPFRDLINSYSKPDQQDIYLRQQQI